MSLIDKLHLAHAEGKITDDTFPLLEQFYKSYAASIAHAGMEMNNYDPYFEAFLARVIEQCTERFQFAPYHERILEPFDYYRFGLDLLHPLVEEDKSGVEGDLSRIEAQMMAGENAIFFANHQTEIDPQLLSLVVEKTHPKVASEVIFVAGHRVTTDVMAIPFSMGRNLLCIFSKRHIDNPPEEKQKKQHHNQRTMRVMREMLAEGGQCIYVAPSGGRDRPNAQGEMEVASFDSSSVEMFRLMAKQARTPTHFYPLSLYTYKILPPPPAVEKDLGEWRNASRAPARFCFGDELDMEHFPGSELEDRHARREALTSHIYNIVKRNYDQLKDSL